MKKLLYLVIIAIVIFIAFNYEEIKDRILKEIYQIEYSEYVESYCEKYDVDTELIYAIIKAESNFNSKAVSRKGAMRTYATYVSYS
ncbi:MAG: lytic transglycosylase domain-containing protein [Clostridia bacterium]|nr:lytic transglycosylase domain-containing protein [Clostridia bacterium]